MKKRLSPPHSNLTITVSLLRLVSEEFHLTRVYCLSNAVTVHLELIEIRRRTMLGSMFPLNFKIKN